RHERLVLAGRQAGAPGLRRLRPRPAGVAQRVRAGDSGRAPDPGGARAARAPLVREDERRGRDPRARAGHAALLVTGGVRVRGAGVPEARGGKPGSRDDRVAEEEAARRARRPPPERARQDDRLRLLGATQAGRAGLDAAPLGGARREGAAARLRKARSAGPRAEARRPVRARAAGRAGARACAARSPEVTRALVVGSGPNGLAAAIALAQRGVEGEVREAVDPLGGGVHTEELTLPGYLHDVCVTVLPLALGSPFFRTLDLPVGWVQPDAPAAHPLDDGTAVMLERSIDATVEGLGRDGEAYRKLVGPLVEAGEGRA